MMKFLVLAAIAIPALAMPEPVSGNSSLLTRDFPKLNQHSTLDGWKIS
ncbi:hypothetical protein PTTW11_04707 [Pyrenophora teres f. teres]|uniref:Uncharacterized protein n=1 Tax=Pyrenophora teres f. teres TaxID=97479 RepID=A0A6S6W009_9PLEO|nr:hypothetical protein PTTW11_04707 [Pyrenophora teres f. teres]